MLKNKTPEDPLTFPLTFIRLVLAVLVLQSLSACSVQEDPDSRIYFSVKTMGPSVNIYSVNDSGAVNKHTDDTRWRDLDADVSKTGSLVFVSNRRDNPTINLQKFSESYDLYLLMPGQPAPTRLLEMEGLEMAPQYSPDESTIAFVKKANMQHVLMLLKQGINEPQPLLTSRQIESYEWSADSTSILVAHSGASESKIEIFNTQSGEVETLVSLSRKAPENQPDFKPNNEDSHMKLAAYTCWSPDESKVAYIRNPIFKGIRQLRLYDRKTGEDQLISEPEAHAQDHCDWNADGTKILYSALVDYRFYFDEEIHKKVYEGGMHIFEYSLKNGNTQLTRGDHMFKRPVYSPNEKHIAFLYSEQLGARSYQLNIMKKDGTDIHQLHDMVSPISKLVWQTVAQP